MWVSRGRGIGEAQHRGDLGEDAIHATRLTEPRRTPHFPRFSFPWVITFAAVPDRRRDLVVGSGGAVSLGQATWVEAAIAGITSRARLTQTVKRIEHTVDVAPCIAPGGPDCGDGTGLSQTPVPIEVGIRCGIGEQSGAIRKVGHFGRTCFFIPPVVKEETIHGASVPEAEGVPEHVLLDDPLSDQLGLALGLAVRIMVT